MTGRLAGMGIVVTRPLAAARKLAAALAAEGAQPYVCPAIAIEPVEADAASLEALRRMPAAHLVIFVSANAVAMGVALARRHGAWPARGQLAAVGDATAAALREEGGHDVLSPGAQQDSDGLLALAALQDVADRDVVIVRGIGGRERLRETLLRRGARVTALECYRRVRPDTDTTAVQHAGAQGAIHAVSALSAETLDNFLSMMGVSAQAWLARVALVVPHPAIAAHPHAAHFARTIVAPAGAEGIVRALATPQLQP